MPAIFSFFGIWALLKKMKKSLSTWIWWRPSLYDFVTRVELFSQSRLTKTFDVHIFAWTLFNHLIINVTFMYWPFQVKSFNIDLITPPSFFMYLYFHFIPCSLILIIYIIMLDITNIFIYLFSKFNHILLIYHIQNLIGGYKFFYILILFLLVNFKAFLTTKEKH